MFASIKKIFSKKEKASESELPKKSENFDSAVKIFEYFTSVTGMHFNKKEKITTDKIINYCRRNGLYSFEELYDDITTSKESMQKLIDYLTVNETFFYRELDQIELLCKIVRKNNSKISILCAPCATGEEVYSIIIALFEAGIESHRIEVTGIDINESAIERAKKGEYSARSLNRLNDTLIEKYFNKTADGYKIKADVKEMAKFQRINIFDENFKNLGKFDYIFSRNMFIYFNKEERKRAMEIFCTLLKDCDAYVFFGHADTIDETECLIKHHIDRTKVYLKA